MVGRQATSAPARRHPRRRAAQATEQRDPAAPVRREGQRRRALDREADGRRHRHRNGLAGKADFTDILLD